MAYKVFLAPTGSGNIVFEGDVLNGYTSPDGKSVHLQFYSNDRGYTAALYKTDFQGAKGLLQELKSLLSTNGGKAVKFEADSENRNFRLAREFDNGPLILFCNGTDPLQGRGYHRGSNEVMNKLLAEFEQVLQTVQDVMAGKGPSE